MLGTRRLELEQRVPTGSAGRGPESDNLALGFPSLGTEVARSQSRLFLVKQTNKQGRVERACCR